MEDIIYLSSDKIFGPTVEGEGRFVGFPSIFMRLAMCNLTCNKFTTPDSPYGCDSYISWSIKNKYTISEIFDVLEKNNYISNLKDGTIFKISGGEPLLQQKSLIKLFTQFVIRYEFRPTIDFETNGTIPIDPQLPELFGATFTTSPKLSNNGDSEERRYKPKVLRQLVELNACFKFVVKDEADIQEVYDRYINAPDIRVPKSLVWLMPCCGSRKEHIQIGATTAELALKHGFKFSPRLHLILWDMALSR